MSIFSNTFEGRECRSVRLVTLYWKKIRSKSGEKNENRDIYAARKYLNWTSQQERALQEKERTMAAGAMPSYIVHFFGEHKQQSSSHRLVICVMFSLTNQLDLAYTLRSTRICVFCVVLVWNLRESEDHYSADTQLFNSKRKIRYFSNKVFEGNHNYYSRG